MAKDGSLETVASHAFIRVTLVWHAKATYFVGKTFGKRLTNIIPAIRSGSPIYTRIMLVLSAWHIVGITVGKRLIKGIVSRDRGRGNALEW
jgi:hypothetical protein